MVWYSKLWVKLCLLVIVAGSALGVYAYYVLFQSIGDLKVSITSEPLKFSMELDKSEFLYGKNMTIKFRLENIGIETVTIRRSSPGYWHRNYRETSYHDVHANPFHLKEFHFGFSVKYTNGTELINVGRGLLPYGYQFDIDPNGWLEQSIIACTIDVPEDPDSHTYVLPLQRGTYRITGVFRYYPAQLPYITLETPSTTFVIQ